MNYDDFENDKKKTHDKVAIHQLINFNNDANNIKISVVVPIFNVEDYIGDCLDSILDQSLKEFEVICVNDGSTDSSLEILKEYAAKDNRIKIINKDNAGYGHTMNIGMDMASGEYFVIVESDDFILPKMFETLYDAAKENDLDFVKSNLDIRTLTVIFHDHFERSGDYDDEFGEYETRNPNDVKGRLSKRVAYANGLANIIAPNIE